MDDLIKSKILVVDDESSNIMALTQILAMEYTIYAAKDGESAINAAIEYMPDVIILDILMPDMNGYDVICELQKNEKTRNIPVIFITGLNKPNEEEKGLSLGAADYITKPFSQGIVQLRVRNQIKLKQQMRQIIENEFKEERSRVKIEFLTRMSHEMLTPMNAIMGMTQIIKASKNQDKLMSYIGKIDKASQQLLDLINDLLDVSGSKEGVYMLNEANFSFTGMFSNIFDLVKGQIEEKKQIFTYEIDDAIPDVLKGDEKRLSQAITNLIVNAIKFTQNEGAIKFMANVKKDVSDSIVLQIEVADNGIGISKEHHNEIFNAFGQADISTTRKYSGTGLGLTITKHIVEMMEGKIWVESEIDKGTKFTFTCKIKKEDVKDNENNCK